MISKRPKTPLKYHNNRMWGFHWFLLPWSSFHSHSHSDYSRFQLDECGRYKLTQTFLHLAGLLMSCFTRQTDDQSRKRGVSVRSWSLIGCRADGVSVVTAVRLVSLGTGFRRTDLIDCLSKCEMDVEWRNTCKNDHLSLSLSVTHICLSQCFRNKYGTFVLAKEREREREMIVIIQKINR